MQEQTGTELVLDVGNSFMKIALFRNGQALVPLQVPHGDMGAVDRLLEGVRPVRCIIGSVARPDERFMEALHALAPVKEITGDSPSPVRSLYTTKTTLGVDRLANVAAVAGLYPHRPALAVDLGTCITYDLVDASTIHRGGMISPGLTMRAKAMHAYSARLPEVPIPEDPPLPGTDTAASLAAGVYHGVLHELKGYIGLFRREYPELAVVLTGGDALHVAKAMKSGIFVHPALTLLGLHILAHHEKDPRPPVDR